VLPDTGSQVYIPRRRRPKIATKDKIKVCLFVVVAVFDLQPRCRQFSSCGVLKQRRNTNDVLWFDVVAVFLAMLISLDLELETL
jgi:hypothetical protein